MGKMSFLLPPHLPADLTAEMQQSFLVGGLDNSPVPTAVRLTENRLELSRNIDESGFWMTPWDADDCGRLMLSTPTLIEREEPYIATIELARGKLNQLRNAVADWQYSGLRLSDQTLAELQNLNRSFAQAVAEPAAGDSARLANQVLIDTCRLIERMLPQQADQILQRRMQSQPQIEAMFGCCLSQLPTLPDEFVDTFNTVGVALTWRDIEPIESNYSWEAADTLLDWAEAHELRVVAGPVIDFSGAGLPDWLSLWEGDVPNLANFMCDYVEILIKRYGNRIRRWHLSHGANLADFLNLNEDETLFLTAKLAETAIQMNPNLELVLGIAQPWGEYLAREDFTYTPIVFLDQLLRAGLRLAAIDLELVPGVSPRGSYCRDLLELSRLFDHYSSLGTPIQVTLGFPSSSAKDIHARPGWEVSAGKWHAGFSPESQADWAEQAATLALSRPFVCGLHWTHFGDAQPHRFPNCGLIDADGKVKPALVRLSRLRARYLS